MKSDSEIIIKINSFYGASGYRKVRNQDLLFLLRRSRLRFQGNCYGVRVVAKN